MATEMSELVKRLRGRAQKLTNALGTHTWEVPDSMCQEAAARIEALEEALRVFHYYVCASDRELQDDGITREDALRKAYTLHDAALPHP